MNLCYLWDFYIDRNEQEKNMGRSFDEWAFRSSVERPRTSVF